MLPSLYQMLRQVLISLTLLIVVMIGLASAQQQEQQQQNQQAQPGNMGGIYRLSFFEFDVLTFREGKDHVLVEAIITEQSSIIGKTLYQFNFRRKLSSFVLAVKRQTELLREKVAHIKLKFSDTLLILIPRDKIDRLKSNSDFIVMEELDLHLRYERFWWMSILVIPMVMILSALEIISISS